MSACCIKRVITLKEPTAYHKIQIIDSEGIDYAANCLYSWSSDGVCWSDWSTFTEYNTICPNLGSDFFIKILINSSLAEVRFDTLIVTCYSIEIYAECQFDKDVCASTNLLNPYAGLDCAIMMQQQLADTTICIFGTPIYYFKVGPVKSSADYTFKEYVLHEVQTVKQLKMIFPADSMPSSKPMITDFDFDWENDWDVEISKRQFARAFGDEVRPAERDFLFCPLTNKMYHVNGAWQEREKGLMYQASTWKLALRKWEDDTALSKGMFELPIDDLVGLKYEEVFHDLESKEQERESGIGQADAPVRASNTLYNIFTGDAIRKQAAVKNISIVDYPLWHKSVQISFNRYIFNNYNDVAVTYQKKYCGDEGTVIMLLSANTEATTEGTLFKIGSITATYADKQITFGDCRAELTSENNIIILSWSHDLMVQTLLVLPVILPERYNAIPKYKIRPQMYEVDFTPSPSKTIYNIEYIINKPSEVQLYGSDFGVCYFKLFDTYMNKETAVQEALKYTTVNEHCVINDVARPIEGELGFSVK